MKEPSLNSNIFSKKLAAHLICRFWFFLFLFFLFPQPSFSQSDTLKPSIKVSGYIDLYYTYDFGNPNNHNRLPFAYSHSRHNEPNLNLGFMKAAFESKTFRVNMALMTGSYSMANLASEPGVLKHFLEANVGLKLSKTKNLWIDAGIFSSHIGFESAISKDCWNLTRSILADNTPYYESGLKLTLISKNEKWLLCGLLLNGWQRIRPIPSRLIPAFGHQLSFKPNSRITFNSSSYIGNEAPDTNLQMRFFHNFYTQFLFSKNVGITLGFDIGVQQSAFQSSNYHLWYSPVVIAKYNPTQRVSIAARTEFYKDPQGVIIPTTTSNGFQTWSYSLNLDYAIQSNLVWRFEGRGFTSYDPIFLSHNLPSNQNWFVTSSIAWSF
jgi:hypothetical protein